MAVSKTDYAAKSALEFFLKSIDYPEDAPAGATSFVLQVDGGDIAATATGSALRLVCRLTDDAADSRLGRRASRPFRCGAAA